MAMPSGQKNPEAGGRKAVAPRPPAESAQSPGDGGKPEGQKARANGGKRYFAYARFSDGTEVRFGGYKKDGAILLKSKSGETATITYNSEGGIWTGEIKSFDAVFNLVGKVRKAASGTEYLYLWNPDSEDYRPSLSVFRVEAESSANF